MIFRRRYRWFSKYGYKNIQAVFEDIYYGIRNIIRWTPVIWYDADFDWSYLANVMQYKLQLMASCFEKYGHHTNSELDARRCRVCVELLKRLNSDGAGWHWDNARKRYGSTSLGAKRAHEHQEADKKYLGLLFGKYINHWWD